jgi:hypothetical protein
LGRKKRTDKKIKDGEKREDDCGRTRPRMIINESKEHSNKGDENGGKTEGFEGKRE